MIVRFLFPCNEISSPLLDASGYFADAMGTQDRPYNMFMIPSTYEFPRRTSKEDILLQIDYKRTFVNTNHIHLLIAENAIHPPLLKKEETVWIILNRKNYQNLCFLTKIT